MINVEEYLNNFFRGTKNPSLKAMNFFINHYNNFEKEMKFIHIAGTNGKGSCTEIISNILIKQGYKVGKFLSPHLINYNERISINGKNITNQEMSDLIEELQPLIKKYNETENINITLFELITIISLLFFHRNDVDFVVLETGLGGLYDCTNIITKPLVSIITSIGYDHMHILGNTLPEIAYQKAGIIKNNSQTVIFEQEPNVNSVFIEQCKRENNILHIVKNSDILNYHFDENYQYFDYKDIHNVCLNLKGKIQIHNACICIEAIKILKEYGYNIAISSILDGLRTVIHRGRMELLYQNPQIIYDGAHNEPAIKNLLEMIQMYYPNKRRVYIISILGRKDYTNMLKLLSEDKNATFIMTSGNSDKFTSNSILYDCMKQYTDEKNIQIDNLESAIKTAMNGNKDNVFIVTGSFYPYQNVIQAINSK